MFSQRVRRVMEQEKLLTAAPDVTVAAAAQMMVGSRAGAVVVVDGGLVVGIFTERDAVSRVIAPGCDPQTTSLATVMTAAPLTIGPDKTFGHALRLMHEHGVRHMPVVEDGRPVGIVTSRNAMDPELEEFVVEALRREGSR
jgi:CBS domain-containing protein